MLSVFLLWIALPGMQVSESKNVPTGGVRCVCLCVSGFFCVLRLCMRVNMYICLCTFSHLADALILYVFINVFVRVFACVCVCTSCVFVHHV